MGEIAIGAGLFLMFFWGVSDAEAAHCSRKGLDRPPIVSFLAMAVACLVIFAVGSYMERQQGQAVERLRQHQMDGWARDAQQERQERAQFEQAKRMLPPAYSDPRAQAAAAADADPAIRAIMDATRVEIEQERAAMGGQADDPEGDLARQQANIGSRRDRDGNTP